MTTREKIEVMESFERGDEIEIRLSLTLGTWEKEILPIWNWSEYDYRIKPKPKQVVVIEKWLVWLVNLGQYTVIEDAKEAFEQVEYKKVKLLATYEVEL